MKKRRIIKASLIATLFVLFANNITAQINPGTNIDLSINNSSSVGDNNTGGGLYSFSSGINNIANNSYAVALGRNNKALGFNSIVLGYNSQASEYFAIAIGASNVASGRNSISIGLLSRAFGKQSVVLGNYVVAQGANSFAIGEYLTTTVDRAFAIGLGVDNSSRLINKQSNSLMIGFNSNLPSVFVGPSSGTGTTGKVGISITKFPTTLGGADLSDYRLFVKGGILTEEIRVRTGWADYVFADDYQLTSLDEVDAFIEANGHLPNVPSATEVEAGGIELGEIARIQQEKIEELTLYLIQMKKEIQELKSIVLEKKSND